MQYRAAFLSYQAVFWQDGPSTFERNTGKLVEFAAEAKTQGADIIVTPECAIAGFSGDPKSSWIEGGWYQQWDADTNPCDYPSSFLDAPSLVSLSCAAKTNKIAIVANLPRLVGGNLYNTAIAFTESGELTSYAKQNLWGEAYYIDVPEGNNPKSFTTDFGVTFGLVICADLIYNHPLLDLLADQNIRDFVAPVAWSNEMVRQAE